MFQGSVNPIPSGTAESPCPAAMLATVQGKALVNVSTRCKIGTWRVARAHVSTSVFRLDSGCRIICSLKSILNKSQHPCLFMSIPDRMQGRCPDRVRRDPRYGYIFVSTFDPHRSRFPESSMSLGIRVYNQLHAYTYLPYLVRCSLPLFRVPMSAQRDFSQHSPHESDL